MSKHQENVPFKCERCAHQIEKLTNGSYRNHCPACLWSKHVDQLPGDRANPCRGLMEPIGLARHKKKGWQIVHRCTKCHQIKKNIVANDTIQADRTDLLVCLSRRVLRI